MKSRVTHNRILSFIDNGIRIDDFQLVVNHFLSHFQLFMGTDTPPSTRLDMKLSIWVPVCLLTIR